jgi:histidine ammonia-lyase
MMGPRRVPGAGEADAAALIEVGGRRLRLEDLAAVARGGARVALDPVARARVEESRRVVDEAVAAGWVIYGVTTGFGRFSDVTLGSGDTRSLQRNLLLSHATGVGPPFPVDVVRGMLLLRANALALGYSGVRPLVIETLLEMLNRGIHPRVPEQGSLGASGDLAPLAHLALVAIGEGEALSPGGDGDPVPGGQALSRAGLEPLVLEAKEGVALINGTQAMTALLGLAVHDAFLVVEAATVAACLSLEALRGVRDHFDERVALVRPHPGQALVAGKVRELTRGSRYLTAAGELRVQDAYSLRCVPQVHGACADALAWAAAVVETEMNSATDNPLVFAETGEVLSGGNFHGQPVAFAGDLVALALTDLASISERRIARLVDPIFSAGLPAFLTLNGGLHSGFMLVQYTAAALVSESKVLASPASVDSIPSSAGQEDHVSMGTVAARKARAVVENAARVAAAELLTAAQAIDLRGGLEGLDEPGGDPLRLAAPLGEGVRPHYLALRRVSPFVASDRPLSADIETVARMVLRGEFRW